ncbi:MAG TPA: hypothetical protein VHU40_08920 [Polyangia bacterium]|nr:hypothetical protein [Polyangia bacterium]
MAWPAVDFIATSLQGVRVLYAATQPASAYTGVLSKTGSIAFGTGVVTLFVASGLVGTNRVNRCRASAIESDPEEDRAIHERARQIQRQRQLLDQERQQRATEVAPAASPNDAWGSPSTTAPPAAPAAAPPPVPGSVPQVQDAE